MLLSQSAPGQNSDTSSQLFPQTCPNSPAAWDCVGGVTDRQEALRHGFCVLPGHALTLVSEG